MAFSGDGDCRRRRPQDLTAGVWSACRIPREIRPTEVSACSESTLLSRLSFSFLGVQSHSRNLQLPQRFLLQEIAGDLLLEVELMDLSLAAGTNDTATFPDYHIYVSNQTSNTILLAVR
jgi:hypothetical protein